MYFDVLVRYNHSIKQEKSDRMSTVLRVEKNRNYTVMSNQFLRNKELSLKAKGLLAVCLSLPDDCIRVKKTNLEQKLLDYELIETGNEDRIYDRIDYEHGRGTSFIKGEDGSCDNITVGINKAARKEKVRKAIQESKRKAKKKNSKR